MTSGMIFRKAKKESATKRELFSVIYFFYIIYLQNRYC